MELVHWFTEWVYWFFDLVLHLDSHLIELLRQYGFWVYFILFAIVFAETGFVITPFLPGDALLFAAGALAAVDSSGTLTAPLVCLTLVAAAVAGNTTNYHIGRWIGPPAFSGKYRFLKVKYLQRTERFFARHGSMTLVLARFVPVVRTCVPFVAGIARMPYARFQGYNFLGALVWVLLLVWAGFFFGNLPLIKNNFGFVTIGIVIVSVLPMAWVALKEVLKK